MASKVLKVIIGFILTVALLFGAFLGFLTVTDLNHESVEPLTAMGSQTAILDHTKAFKVTTFNIGYGGLDQGQDFFADGGKTARSKSLEQTQGNLQGVTDFLSQNNADFVYLQEVDQKALRSFKIDEYQWITDHMDQYNAVFANNYHAQWVPVPITQPMGYVDAGMVTLSKYKMAGSNRYQLNGQESWPMKLMELDRCFVESEIKMDNGKSLFLINLHLSAYDEGGILRNQQAQHLISRMTELYNAGNYVVLGGDWNQLLSSVQEKDPVFMEKWPSWLVKAPDALMETGFNWAVDETQMTVRDLVSPYVKGETFVTIIDGFLVSPNLEIIQVQTHDLDFKNSDHNPVTCTLKLK